MGYAGRWWSSVNADQFESIDPQFSHVIDPCPKGRRRIGHYKQDDVTKLDKQFQVIVVRPLFLFEKNRQ